jgi:hypothetical protein
MVTLFASSTVFSASPADRTLRAGDEVVICITGPNKPEAVILSIQDDQAKYRITREGGNMFIHYDVDDTGWIRRRALVPASQRSRCRQ